MALEYGDLKLRSQSLGLSELEEFFISVWNCGSGRLMDLDDATHHNSLDIFFFLKAFF